MATHSIPMSHGIELPEGRRETLRTLVGRLGETAVVKAVGVARPTLIRCMAGMPVHKGTVAMVSAALDEIRATEDAAGPTAERAL
jgi:hypothetical protein